MFKRLLVSASVVVGGCSSLNTPPPTADLNDYDFVCQVFNDSGVLESATRGSIEETWCRYQGAFRTYLNRSDRSYDFETAHSLIVFGSAAYLGTTLALNPDGLNETQAEDAREVGVGLGVLQASRLLFDPERQLTVYDRAVTATICHLEHVEGAINRTANITWLESGHSTALREDTDNLRTMRRLILTASEYDNADEVANDTTARALEAIDSAEETLEDVRTQTTARSGFNDIARSELRNFSNTVRTRLRSNGVSLEAAVNSIRSSARTVEQFSAGDEVPPDDDTNNRGEKGFDEDDFAQLDLVQQVGQLQLATRDLERETAILRSVLPDYVGLTSSFRTCALILDTGVSVRLELNDNARGSATATPVFTRTTAPRN